MTVPEPPGDGEPVVINTQSFAPAPPPVDRNSAWQQINAEVGSDLDVRVTPASEYTQVFSVAMAGEQLGDMFFVAEVARIPEFLEAQAVDLSEYLSGDAILQYPNLAAIPSAMWEAGRFNGKLYGLPSPRGSMSSGVMYRREDLLAKRGITEPIDSFETFVDQCREMNDPASGRYALTRAPLQYIRNMLNVPNFWRWDGGTMTSWWTVPEQEEALDAARSMVEEGLVHPNAFINPQTKEWFANGTCSFNQDSLSAWAAYFGMGSLSEGYDPGVLEIPTFEGGGDGALWLSFPSFGRSAINRSAEDRVETLLGIANYLAAPFGSREFLSTHYGAEGSDYNMEDGTPVPTPQGAENRQLGLNYIAEAAQVNFVAGRPEAGKKLAEILADIIPQGINNDAVYLQSETFDRNFDRDNRAFQGLEADILSGRQPVSAWSTQVDSWRRDGGDQMAVELAEAYVAAGRG
ncbi:hypothetical protein CGZ92_07835 [Parenemella sanctibonifatiensis]|uniref:Extracellular solute-binding protein n=1 Tax=Parenemella sanctibonifatiensis TaxID=2016505 RepID=A0A255E9L1_9ACTN|nr:hypothetical protein CGZ92_07835 [Parenemella sanctibonifatiensis]